MNNKSNKKTGLQAFMRELVKEVIAEKKKGIDGKACWKGYRYAGTKDGKDKCIPVKGLKESKATCCGRCGRVHIPKSKGGHGCKKPYLSKTSPKHCKSK